MLNKPPEYRRVLLCCPLNENEPPIIKVQSCYFYDDDFPGRNQTWLCRYSGSRSDLVVGCGLVDRNYRRNYFIIDHSFLTYAVKR